VTSANKRKGDLFNRQIIKHLIAEGITDAHRYQDGYHLDRGDVAGIPGIVIQAKNVVQVKWSNWFLNVRLQQVHAASPIGILALKRQGRSDPAEATAILERMSWWDLRGGRTPAKQLALGTNWKLSGVLDLLDKVPDSVIFVTRNRAFKSIGQDLIFMKFRTVVPFIKDWISHD
jgi:hypothetical protein